MTTDLPSPDSNLIDRRILWAVDQLCGFPPILAGFLTRVPRFAVRGYHDENTPGRDGQPTGRHRVGNDPQKGFPEKSGSERQTSRSRIKPTQIKSTNYINMTPNNSKFTKQELDNVRSLAVLEIVTVMGKAEPKDCWVRPALEATLATAIEDAQCIDDVAAYIYPWAAGFADAYAKHLSLSGPSKN